MSPEECKILSHPDGTYAGHTSAGQLDPRPTQVHTHRRGIFFMLKLMTLSFFTIG
jgi:hypothetical protein